MTPHPLPTPRDRTPCDGTCTDAWQDSDGRIWHGRGPYQWRRRARILTDNIRDLLRRRG